MKVFKSRFVAYKFFKDGKRIPGLLTVSQGRLLPEFNDFSQHVGYIAGWPASQKPDTSDYFAHTPENLKWWKDVKGANKIQRIIVESNHAYY